MRTLIRFFLSIVAGIAVLYMTPEILWRLGTEGALLSLLPTDFLVAHVQEPFWHRMFLGLANGAVLIIVAWAGITAWRKWGRDAHVGKVGFEPRQVG